MPDDTPTLGTLDRELVASLEELGYRFRTVDQAVDAASRAFGLPEREARLMLTGATDRVEDVSARP